MIELSDRINAMEESATIAMSRKSRELKAEGKDVIALSLGEPDFNTSQFIKDAAIQAMDENFTKYTPVPGFEDLREAIAHKFKRDNDLDFDVDQIVVSTGAKQSIANVVLSLVGRGDEVIIPAPYWVSYIEIVKVSEGTPVMVNAGIENDFKISGAQLEASITDNTKLIIFSTPCNPTGSVYSKEELRGLADVLVKYPHIVVIADEIYEHINFTTKHASLAQFDDIKDQVVTVNGVSKAWAMTGWRLGYIGASKKIAGACTKMQGQFTSAPTSITQKASIAAVQADPSVLSDMITAFKSRRELVLSALGEIKGVKTNVPEGAFYVFPDVSYFFGKSHNGTTIKNASDLAMYILDEGLVAIVTGDAFGDPSCIRISYAASEETLIEAMKRIRTTLEKLN
ncbi:MAG: pyridoxal phosphate-dependent aminotransferase [Crocinitomicaceae bacterium]|nr:pyridoxal phosphate-dependent aminotransferase [Crocinitomicaceae bacterium]MDG1658770.1 pyridoxal phosphate-dependent aminotransferase [Crocinitomicaceae bacterium]MDG2440334.1 pyridoxal phosphate-dependent aminotransferase [Crocinitomicaceae bacterium]|tara:strand:+ start:3628 stop:4821 length:1194 start_codon:yes stop_codon:yes gene_type:complete